ncbi:hypothetical protein [Bacillus sp. HNG]|uniref:hypothetical protein n=1 Tax=Bacillus sp. HNG TaxID=2293325 RepID=UPI001CB8C15F|nr:hypothetical protein [Bacillus sp. HNG]
MRKVYVDRKELPGAINVNIKDAEVIPAGTTIYSMSVYHKNEEYQKYVNDYDI